MASLTNLLNQAANAGVKKEFFNGTLTAANLVNGDEYNVIVNDANTTRIIEDVQVDPDVNVAETADLLNEGFKVGENTNASGSDLLAPSSTLKFKLNATPAGGTITHLTPGEGHTRIPSTTSIFESYISDTIKIEGNNYPLVENDTDENVRTYFDGGHTTSSVIENTLTVPTMSQPDWAFTRSDRGYYLEHNGNNASALWKSTRTGNSFSAWSRVFTNANYLSIALDSENQIAYARLSNTLYKYDMKTDTLTSPYTNIAWPGGSTYAAGGFCNGYYFHVPSNSYTVGLYYINVSTGEMGFLSFSVSVSSYCRIAVTYNPEEDTYYFCIGYNADTYVFTHTGPIVDSASPTSSSMTLPDGRKSFTLVYGTNTGHLYWTAPDGTTRIGTVANNNVTLLPDHTPGSTTTSGNSGPTPKAGVFSASVTVPVSALDTRIKCKISGTEYKGAS